MVSINSFTTLASLLGDPTRASILQALLDGRALTSTELASVAGIAPQTASGHLGLMTRAGFLVMEKQGRHRYFRLASRKVAQLIETIMQATVEITSIETRHVSTGPSDRAMRTARSCYDHLAGKLGVAIADAMIVKNIVELTDDGGIITRKGIAFLRHAGIDWENPERTTFRSSRIACRACLDWSERRSHIAGQLGAALFTHSLKLGWVRRREEIRVLEITPLGHRAFYELLQFRIEL